MSSVFVYIGSADSNDIQNTHTFTTRTVCIKCGPLDSLVTDAHIRVSHNQKYMYTCIRSLGKASTHIFNPLAF